MTSAYSSYSTNTSAENNESNAQDIYWYIDSQGYEKLFKFIRLDVLEKPILITMVELRKLLLDYQCVRLAQQN